MSDPYNTNQPAWISASAVSTAERTRAFIRGVYGWMAGGLMITAFAALWVVMSPAMQQLVLLNSIVRFGLIIAELAIVMSLSFGLTRMSAGTAAAAFLVYSFLNGLTLSVIFWAYSGGSIFSAFVASAGMFGVMSVFGLVTKKDLTSWGSFFFMGLIGIILCSLVNYFLNSGGLSFVISVLGVFIFLGLTAWDNQKLKSYALVEGPMRENVAIIGALALYLDFINLFLFMLRLFGGNRQR
jgi:FtsH-binding integral membrane protein